MRLFLKLFVPLFFALPLALAGAIYLAVDTQPSLNRAAEITPWNIERAKRILDQNDPRKLTPGARRTITVDQADIDLAANYLARQYFAGGARVQLKWHFVHIGASLRAPMIPLPASPFHVGSPVFQSITWGLNECLAAGVLSNPV